MRVDLAWLRVTWLGGQEAGGTAPRVEVSTLLQVVAADLFSVQYMNTYKYVKDLHGKAQTYVLYQARGALRWRCGGV